MAQRFASEHLFFIKPFASAHTHFVSYVTAKKKNIIKGYVVEGSTFWLQIENSGFNSSVSLVALLAKKVPALDICMVFFFYFLLILISSMVEQDTSNI